MSCVAIFGETRSTQRGTYQMSIRGLSGTPDPRSHAVPLSLAAEDAPGRNRTCDLALRRRALYPLSYGRSRPQSSVRLVGCHGPS
jgi:hypothetical protein